MAESNSWYEQYIPERSGPQFEGPAAKAAKRIFDRAAIDDPLRSIMEKMPGELGTTLVEDFNVYWTAQTKRINEEGYPIPQPRKRHGNPNGAFTKEVSFFRTIVENVEETIEHQAGAPTYVLFDVDETVARVPETEKHVEIPENIRRLDGDERRIATKKLMVTDGYERLVIRPSLKHAVKYLKDKYGTKVKFGVLTTKEQWGLDEYLTTMLNTQCNGAFEKEFIMSSRDGAADRLVPELQTWLHEATMRGEPLLFDDALNKFMLAYPEMKEIIPERIVNKNSINYRKGISDYDIKLFMMMRLLALSRKEGIEEMKEDTPAGQYGENWHEEVHPEASFILFDDVVQSMALGKAKSLRYVNVPEFLLPDDLQVRTK